MESAISAATISTYGLYAVISVLIYCIVHLYRKTNELEKELRTVILRFQEERSAYEREIHSEYTALTRSCTEVIAKNTEAMNDIRTVLREQAFGHRVTIPPTN